MSRVLAALSLAESNSIPSMPTGLEAHINNAPSLAHPCVAVTIDQC